MLMPLTRGVFLYNYINDHVTLLNQILFPTVIVFFYIYFDAYVTLLHQLSPAASDHTEQTNNL